MSHDDLWRLWLCPSHLVKICYPVAAGKSISTKPIMSSKKLTERPKIEVENGNVAGYVTRVDAIKYAVMKSALLKIVPKKPPGITQTEMRQAVLTYLPEDEFPGGAKADWWSKCVQLDLEAKGTIKRDRASKPLRWYRTK